MTQEPIIESNMTFGPYPAGNCFHIEKCKSYRAITDGVKMAEFLLLRPQPGKAPVVWIVEAKSSSPKPGTTLDFDEFIAEIRAKLSNALMLGMAVFLKRHAAAGNELPVPFKTLDLAKTGFRFILVIRGHKDEWLSPLHDALSLALKPVIKTWSLPATAVAVLNEAGARDCGLILQAGGAV